jgi:hypothetical protein
MVPPDGTASQDNEDFPGNNFAASGEVTARERLSHAPDSQGKEDDDWWI